MEGQRFFTVSEFVMWGADGNPMFKQKAIAPDLVNAFAAAKDMKLNAFIIQFSTILVASGIPAQDDPINGKFLLNSKG